MNAKIHSIRNMIISLLCLSAFAGAGAEDYGENEPRRYHTLFAGYNLYALHPSDAASFTMNGFVLGYSVDFKISKTWPIYIGTGADMRFDFRVKTFRESPTYNPIAAKTTTRFINLNLPLNLSYRVDASPSTSFIPQFGFDFRVQLSARSKVNVSVPEESPVMSKASRGYTDGNYNLLSRSQMGGEVMRRCQVGWHAGLKLRYESLAIGVTYGTDFARLRNELGASNLMVNIGYVF